MLRGLCIWMVFCLGFISFPEELHAQYRRWSLAASIGYNRLNLNAVDDKNSQDVEGWNRQGIAVGQFASVRQSPVYSASVYYRYNREYSVSLSGSYWTKTVSTSYNGADASLQLERGVGATDILFGISYYPSARLSFLEWYVQTNLGMTMARATAKALGSVMQKQGPDLVPVTFVDTDGRYTKSKLTAGVLTGADVRFGGGVSLTVQACYRFAQLGTMDGDVTQMGEKSVQTSTIEFDYSGFQVSAGIRLEL